MLLDSKQLRPNYLSQLVRDLLPVEESIENAHSTIAKKVLALKANENENFLGYWIANIVIAMLHHRQCRAQNVFLGLRAPLLKILVRSFHLSFVLNFGKAKLAVISAIGEAGHAHRRLHVLHPVHERLATLGY